MAIKFQYNKTALQSLNKQLNLRIRALPTLKNKEAALRMEVSKAKHKIAELDTMLKSELDTHADSALMWTEFIPDLLAVSDVVAEIKVIAGVKTPIMKEVVFKEEEFSLF